MLYQASGSGSNNADPYRTAVVDTLVAEVQNVPGDDRCVLLAGYKSEMEQMFQVVLYAFCERLPFSDYCIECQSRLGSSFRHGERL
jgi:hypothetical protein